MLCQFPFILHISCYVERDVQIEYGVRGLSSHLNLIVNSWGGQFLNKVGVVKTDVLYCKTLE